MGRRGHRACKRPGAQRRRGGWAGHRTARAPGAQRRRDRAADVVGRAVTRACVAAVSAPRGVRHGLRSGGPIDRGETAPNRPTPTVLPPTPPKVGPSAAATPRQTGPRPPASSGPNRLRHAFRGAHPDALGRPASRGRPTTPKSPLTSPSLPPDHAPHPDQRRLRTPPTPAPKRHPGRKNQTRSSPPRRSGTGSSDGAKVTAKWLNNLESTPSASVRSGTARVRRCASRSLTEPAFSKSSTHRPDRPIAPTQTSGLVGDRSLGPPQGR